MARPRMNIPEEHRKRMTGCYLSDYQKGMLDTIARQQSRSRMNLIDKIINEYIEKYLENKSENKK